MYYRRQGESAYTPLSLSADALDSRLYGAMLSVESDADGTVYEWYGQMTNGCGTRSVGTESAPNVFTRVRSTTFADAGYDFTIADEYDQTVTTGGQPLTIRVRNDDSVSHAVVLDVENPYDDLTLGFVASGSVDQVAMLAPGQTFTTVLRVFTQDTTRETYPLMLRLENDAGQIDRVPLTVRIRQPRVELDVEILEVDPRTLVTYARLTNLGDTLTDLTLNIVQDGTGIPANMVIQPDVRHTYLRAAQTLDVAFIPLDLEGVAPEGFSAFGTFDATGPSLASVSGPFRVMASARDIEIPDLTLRGGELSNTCGANGSARTVAAPCTMPAGSETRFSSGWYCTNRPDIDVRMSLGLPNGGFDLPITSVSVGANFNRGTGEVYNHSTTVSFNGSLVGNATVPRQSVIEGIVPTQALMLGGLSSSQLISLRSTHSNDTHYTVASGFRVTVAYDEHERTGCFTPEEVADAADGPLECSAGGPLDSSGSQLYGLRLNLALKEGVDPNHIKVGDRVPVVAHITNANAYETTSPVVLNLNVPVGLAPAQVKIRGDIFNILSIVIDLAKHILDDFPFGEISNVLTLYKTDDWVDIGYSFVVGRMSPFEARTFELEVLAEERGGFVIAGIVATQNDSNPEDDSILFSGQMTLFQEDPDIDPDSAAIGIPVNSCYIATRDTSPSGSTWILRETPNPNAQPSGSVPAQREVHLFGWHVYVDMNGNEQVFFRLIRQESVNGEIIYRYRWISGLAFSSDPRAQTSDPDCPKLPPLDSTGQPFALQLSKIVNPTLARAGENITYQITLENTGDEELTSITVVDMLPDALQNVHIGSGGNAVGSAIEWDIPQISPQETVALTVSGRVGTTLIGQMITNEVRVDFIPDSDTGVTVTLTDTVDAAIVTCTQTVQQNFNLYAQRVAAGQPLAEITPGTQVGLIGRFIDDPSWARVAFSTGSTVHIGWLRDMPMETDCASNANVDAEGKPTLVPTYNPETQCLARLNEAKNVYSLVQIRNLTNPAAGIETPIRTLTTQSYVVITAIHPNRQYVQVRYGIINASGDFELLNEDNHWIKVRQFIDSSYTDLAIQGVNESCKTAQGNLPRERIETFVRRITDGMLPPCRSTDLVNCRPTYASPAFELFLTEFGNPLDGADQLHYGACPLWENPPENNGHCGDDLVRRADAERNDRTARQVYTLVGGIYREWGGLDSDGTYKIRIRVSPTLIHEYQYTHVEGWVSHYIRISSLRHLPSLKTTRTYTV